jgi:hypothetical protein
LEVELAVARGKMSESRQPNGRAGSSVPPDPPPPPPPPPPPAGSSKKSKNKKGADATETGNLISLAIANLERSQAGNREQEQEIGMCSFVATLAV